ncbi:response regulator receiver protein [Magnetococcus marinus MC-1]|uniref:Response regulator receiver protein n=1 Tax=Magnetococcus marinus (strain ATCC BAA-1437 / JCM 17883 / MC-1) TaxID=156889 RepID=A0LDM2_MAGMM|nr:SpoIIE family protein phosphatase [Magnetococcus marinus]ABK46065.1 response regulator receiver protein [Magnetococcus marinus MC-1]
MKILIVDDDRINSTILTRLLEKDGHKVFTAPNGQRGVELFSDERPDLVLMDIRMPLMNGYEAARRIKSLSPNRFVPIIFLTAVTDDEGLAKCIDAGGDDFLTKPFNRTILQAKIGAMERIGQLHGVLREQKELLERHQQTIRQELEVGKHLFSKIVQAGNLLDAPCLQHWTAPMSLFNGDLLMASYNPAGGLHIMLGDFTGHGLSAAVGALPISEIFYGLTAQGFSISDLVDEMNAKLTEVLPARMFCAACLIEIDPRQQSLLIWNGGLPDILIADASGSIVRRVRSTHLPLGVTHFTAEDRSVEMVEILPDYRVYLYSDGLTEAINPQGQMYGTDHLESLFKPTVSGEARFQTILEDVKRFRAAAPQNDDISLLEIDCNRAALPATSEQLYQHHKQFKPGRWSTRFRFEIEMLKQQDPLPTMVNALMNIQAPTGHRERLYIILSELFTNALDHGILGMLTATKATPEGFTNYYLNREERLAAHPEGYIQVDVTHQSLENGGGSFTIRVEDSGSGFDAANVTSFIQSNFGHGSRGIALVRSLCQSLEYSGRGNIAEAVYTWNNT